MSSIKQALFYKEYLQREHEFTRASYNPELEFYAAICSGNERKIRELNKQPFYEKQGFGSLSPNPVNNLRYHFVITAALCARHCMESGMEMSQAFGLSDFYIQKADSCTTLLEISDLHYTMSLDYVKRMKKIVKNKITSLPIANCLDYIYDNLHTRITVDTLSKHVKLNPSYLSRLFKKEVGITISEYILQKKIDAAQNMLIYSDYSASQIAFTLAFPSQSYFTEIFRKRTGMTPLKYRAEHLRSLNQKNPEIS